MVPTAICSARNASSGDGSPITYEPMIGMVDSPHEVFVGRGATYVGDPSDVEEAGRVDWVPLADVRALMARGELAGSGTLVALLHVLAFGPPS